MWYTPNIIIESVDKTLFAATNNSREMLDYKPAQKEKKSINVRIE